MRRPPLPRAKAALAASAIVLASRALCAQTVDASGVAARRVLIEQAQEARRAGDHTRSLELSERAAQISMSPSLRLFIAQELNSLGRVAEAFGHTDLCIREAEADVRMRNREMVLGTCRALNEELRGRIGRVEVMVPSPRPSGLAITVGGRPLAETFYGVPYVVTAGSVVVEARAPGYATFRREIDVTAGGSSRVELELERAVAASNTGGGGTSEPDARVATGGADTTPSDRPRAGAGAAPYVLLGIGGVGIAGAVTFLVLRQGQLAQCPENACPDQDTITRAYGFTVAMLGTAVLGVGAVTAGVVMLVTRRAPARNAENTRGASLGFAPTMDGAQVFVGGRF